MDLLIFDMDGVLVDVSESYREAIQQTVEHYTGVRVSRDVIQEYKNQGGWNDDWALSFRLIQDQGASPAFEEVVKYFQELFHGNGRDGLLMRERWLANPELFNGLAKRFHFAVFTGRLNWEAQLTLERFSTTRFEPVVGADNVANTKPAPDGIQQIRRAVPHERVWYVGDTVDDARSAASAGVPFIGIAAASSPLREELVTRLSMEGATAVLEDINGLEDFSF